MFTLCNEEKTMSTSKVPKDSLDFWFLKCKNQIINSTEWKEFVINLQEKVQQLQFKSHVRCFVDLSKPEKVLLIEQAARNVDQNLSCALHHQISTRIKHILTDYATAISTKDNFVISDIIIYLIQDWISSLLKQRPHLKSKLNVFFNQPLQGRLRQMTWACFLHTNQVFRNKPKYDEQSKLPKQLENEIASHCKRLLREINLQSLNSSSNAFKVMKAMVSGYCSACSITSLAIEDFLLTIPFLLTMSPFTSQDLPEKMLATLVEEYLSFMMNRPTFMLQSNQDFKIFVEMVVQLLTEKYPTTTETFSDVLGCSNSDPSELTDSLTEKFMILLKPSIQGMLVAYLNPEALLYVWDQYFICGEVPGLSHLWIRVVIVISLHFLKNHLHLEKSDISSMLLEKWPLISMSDIQYEVQKSFQQDFQNLQEFVHLPTCNISADADWFSYLSHPPHPPELRRSIRERQHLEKKRYVQELLHKKEEETKEQIKNIRDHFEEESNRVQKEMKRVKEENTELLKKLKEEKETLDTIKVETEEKILALQIEISWLKSQVPQTRGMSTVTGTSTLTPKYQDLMTGIPVSRSSYAETRRSIVKEFMKKYQSKVKSSIIPKDDLFLSEDLAQVKSRIQGYIDDIKKSEVKLFQRRLRAGEISLMRPDIQQKTYESILSKMEENLLENKRKQKSAGVKNN